MTVVRIRVLIVALIVLTVLAAVAAVPVSASAPAATGSRRAAQAECGGGRLRVPSGVDNGALKGTVPVVFVHGILSGADVWSDPAADGGASLAQSIGALRRGSSPLPATSVFAFDYSDASIDMAVMKGSALSGRVPDAVSPLVVECPVGTIAGVSTLADLVDAERCLHTSLQHDRQVIEAVLRQVEPVVDGLVDPIDIPPDDEGEAEGGISTPGFPPQIDPALQGGSASAVYLAVADSYDDPALAEAERAAASVGYQAGASDLGCDIGAAAALGRDDQFGAAVAVYFDIPENAAIARDAFEDEGIAVVGVADITFVCVDRSDCTGRRKGPCNRTMLRRDRRGTGQPGGDRFPNSDNESEWKGPDAAKWRSHWESEVRTTLTRIGTQLEDIAQTCTRIAGDIFRAGGA